jgi:hypothetical protein
VRAADALVLVLALAACRPAPHETSAPTPPRPSPIAIDHGPPLPFAGTWEGPLLRVEFGGRWVLVEPRERVPGQAPIELRVEIERREGEAAFALRVAIAGAMPADFLRPADWTLLVEPAGLALAMGDEPLESYVRVDAPAPLVGPLLVEPSSLPRTLPIEPAIACLELAGTQSAAYELEGPRALGLREALWAACVEHVEGLVPAAAPARARLQLDMMLAALQYSSSVLAASSSRPDRRDASEALHARVLAHARELLASVPLELAPAEHARVAAATRGMHRPSGVRRRSRLTPERTAKPAVLRQSLRTHTGV